MSYELGEILFLSSKPWPRLNNQCITFTWFLLKICSYFGSNRNTNRNPHAHLSSSRLVWIVQVDMWSLSRGDANLEGGTPSSMNASFTTPYAQMYHNSKPWEDLEKSLSFIYISWCLVRWNYSVLPCSREEYREFIGVAFLCPVDVYPLLVCISSGFGGT